MPLIIISIGLYCILFVLYIRVHISKQCVDRNVLVYPISMLFVLSTVFFSLDFTQQYFALVSKTSPTTPALDELMHINPLSDAEPNKPSSSSMESEHSYQYNLFFE